MDYSRFIFDFEKLDVYQASLEFTNEVFDVTLQFDREVQYSLGDQFRRAALSICNNLAEGNQKMSKARIQFYHYSLDSSRECIPMIRISQMRGYLREEQALRLRLKCIHIGNMFSRLISSVYC